jgi:hypothetical protein
MIDKDALRWFKQTFGQELAQAAAGTPYSVDLLVAIATQETGEIWAPLRNKLSVTELLGICVGDTLMPTRVASLSSIARHPIAALRGEEMFRIAHDALVSMVAHVPGYTKVAKLPHKFCHGYCIFQYDLQFFLTDPDYFLRVAGVTFSLARQVLANCACRDEWLESSTLTDLEQVAVTTFITRALSARRRD